MANDQQSRMTDRELIVEMSTKIGYMQEQIGDLKNEFKSLAQRHASKADVEKIELAFEKLVGELPQRFVTQEEFALVRKLVYGAVFLILMAVVGSIIRLVVIG